MQYTFIIIYLYIIINLYNVIIVIYNTMLVFQNSVSVYLWIVLITCENRQKWLQRFPQKLSLASGRPRTRQYFFAPSEEPNFDPSNRRCPLHRGDPTPKILKVELMLTPRITAMSETHVSNFNINNILSRTCMQNRKNSKICAILQGVTTCHPSLFSQMQNILRRISFI